MGNLDVEHVETEHVVEYLEPNWLRVPITASRERTRMAGAFAFAIAKKARRAANPADWAVLKHLLTPQPKVEEVEHHPSLPWAELPAFWPVLTAATSLGAIMLQFAILTAARTQEVREAVWDEIDFGTSTWVIPKERMKKRRRHRVPLSRGALAILVPLHELRTSAFVFPGEKPRQPTGRRVMQGALARLKDDISPHGFRSSFRTWAEKTRSEKDVKLAKLALAHWPRDKVDGSYMRDDMLDERRQLMADWDDFVRQPPPAVRLVSSAA